MKTVSKRSPVIEKKVHRKTKEQTINLAAMPIEPLYSARMGKYSLREEGGEFVFAFSRKSAVSAEDVSRYQRTRLVGGAESEEYEDREQRPLDPYLVRAEFEKVDRPTEAVWFLNRTGMFKPGLDGGDLTWTEFKKWQRFVWLVREHKTLAIAAQTGKRTGEEAEVLKAIGGIYDSTYFDDTNANSDAGRDLILAHPEIPELQVDLQEGRRLELERSRELYRWFRNPPFADDSAVESGAGMSIMLAPQHATKTLVGALRKSGAMIEFLLPKEQLKKVLIIQASVTVQAIAATVYADWIAGIDYQECEVCKTLFRVQKNRPLRKYCTKTCKGTAHQRRFRIEQKKEMITKQVKGKKTMKKTTMGRTKPMPKANTSAKMER